MRTPLLLPLAALLAAHQVAGNFPFESVRLTPEDVRDFSAIRPGDLDKAPPLDSTIPRCRAWPGSSDWPSESDWRKLNSSLGGALLRRVPPAAACYPGEHYDPSTCRWLVNESGQTHFWVDDPLTTLTQWPQGSTCVLAANAEGTCTRGGFPEYVVNATEVKHIQAAVNFARNKNVRLIIKNTGHDFGGRSMGAGSLSVWTHNLKDFEFISEYTTKGYSGPAARVAAGIESWELFNHMADNNISLVSPGGRTVGVAGGWLAVAGHGSLTSKYGLGADQVLSINVVTADGRFLTVDSENHEDLWFALRGGGPSTFGIVTSVIFRAYPPIDVTAISLAFAVNPSNTPLNRTVLPGLPPLPQNLVTITDHPAFWRGVSLSYRFCTHVIAVGGYCYSYIHPLGGNSPSPSSFAFTSTQYLPNTTSRAALALLRPLYADLNALRIPVSLPPASSVTPSPYARPRRDPPAAAPVNTRYRSRLFPSRLWADDALWDAAFGAVRASVEHGGYTFHGIAYTPPPPPPPPLPLPRGGQVGSGGAASAVHPAWRDAALHGSLMEVQPAGLAAAEARARDERAQAYVAAWDAVAPGMGAYMNEGDPAEREWQRVFYGPGYGRLVGVKRRWDPWGVFWARTTPGSEGWEVEDVEGYPAGQNGRLCRVRRGGAGRDWR